MSLVNPADSAAGAPAGAAAYFYPPRLRLLLMAAGAAAVAAVSYLPARADWALMAGIGWLLLASLSGAAVVLLLRALRPGPTVVIDQEGITERTALAPAGLVRWEDITVIRKKEIGRGMGAERLLEIVLTEDARFHRRPRSPWRRLIESYRVVVKQPVVSIPGSMVSVPMQQVMDALRRQRPQLQVLEGPPPAPSKFRFSNKPKPGRQHPDLPRW